MCENNWAGHCVMKTMRTDASSKGLGWGGEGHYMGTALGAVLYSIKGSPCFVVTR